MGHTDFINYSLGDTVNVNSSALSNTQIIRFDPYLLYLPHVNQGYFIIYQMNFVYTITEKDNKVQRGDFT